MRREWTLLAGGIGLGAGLMYLLDPNEGRRRRAQLRDQAVHAVHALGDAVDTTARDVAHRAAGLGADLRARLRPDAASDQVVAARVRAALGRVVSHPHSVRVEVQDGRVTLTGPILSREVDDLLATVARVRGVREVVHRLETHAQAGAVPGLQGEARVPARFDLAQQYWTPTTRLIVGTAGGALAAYGLGRGGGLGVASVTAGLAMLARAVTNLSFRRLTGIGAGHRAVDLHRTIHIEAPVEEVFRFCTAYERFPRFLPYVREVRRTPDGKLHWELRGPAGIPIRWDELITEAEPDRRLAWKTVPGSPVQHAGVAHFERNPDGSTRLDLQLSYNPPGGALGHLLFRLLGANPERRLEQDLVRLKSLLEVGKTTVDGREVTYEEVTA